MRVKIRAGKLHLLELPGGGGGCPRGYGCVLLGDEVMLWDWLPSQVQRIVMETGSTAGVASGNWGDG